MEVGEDQAASILEAILTLLREFKATDIISGINESRRLGVEESVGNSPDGPLGKSELRQIGTTRRRPLTGRETLAMAIQRIHQRLIVVPAMAERIRDVLGIQQILWRVDEDFMPTDGVQEPTGNLTEFCPDNVDEITTAYLKLRMLIPEMAPDLKPVS